MSQWMTLSQIKEYLPHAQWINGVASSQEAKRFISDSRQVTAGDIFIAIRGEKFDAHDFLEEVKAKGAIACIVSAENQLPKNFLGILVKDTQQALQELAACWKKTCDQQQLKHSVVVTGSNGKTTVKGMIQSIFNASVGESKALATQGNFNNEIGLPLTLLRLSLEHQLAVIELGMNHPGETALLSNIAQANIALINNAQREHQEFMATVEAVAKEHSLAIEALPANGVAVFPADSEYSSYWKQVAGNKRTIDFAFNAPASVSGQWLDASANQIRINTPQGSIDVCLQILGEHNARNAVAATAVAIAAEVPLATIQLGLEQFQPVNGRMQKHQINAQTTVIDDSYNANPDSVRAAVDVLSTLNMPAWLVLGDMGEVGEQGPEFHREVGVYAGEKGIQKLFATGDLSKEAVMAYKNTPSAKGTAHHFSDVQDLCAELKKSLGARNKNEETTILVKGSRFMRMERVVKALAEEIH
jgi:UDP-N-acetylmuramoyl-tripeptide--D-alanyl-D-alanine ligase